MMRILSANDFSALSDAMRSMQKLTLTRTLGGAELTAEVRRAPAVWHVAMVVQVRARERGVEWVQTFESVEEVMRCFEKCAASG